jgi:hypothetical protein
MKHNDNNILVLRSKKRSKIVIHGKSPLDSKDIIRFEEVILCGIMAPAMDIQVSKLPAIRKILIAEGVLNPSDSLEEELKCRFYSQMVHLLLHEHFKSSSSTIAA